MSKTKSIRMALAVAVLVFVSVASSHAFMTHENKLTFSGPVALPGVVLPAGSYSFDVMDNSSSLDVVIVRNASRTKTYYLGFTNTIARPRALPANTAVTFGETTANTAPPIAVWYPIGQSIGHQFLYR
jgi:hypothetical protein